MPGVAAETILLNFRASSAQAVAEARRVGAAVRQTGREAQVARPHIARYVGALAAIGGAGVALYEVSKAFRAVTSDMLEGQRVGAQTNAVLKSTGNQAGITAQGVQALATALEHKSKFDDEAIKSGENMLLTFRNIRNVTGQNNDIFNQATKSLVDMATAYNTSTGSTDGLQRMSILLGKALNDPLKGMTALQRVGVTLDSTQKEQIKTALLHNNILGAQRVILDELSKEFSGSAAASASTFSGQMTILKNSLTDTGSSIEQVFLPMMTRAATAMANFVNSPEFQQGAQRLQDWLQNTLIPLISSAFGWVSDHWGQITGAITAFAQFLSDIFNGVGDIIGAITGKGGLVDSLGGAKGAIIALGVAWALWRTHAIQSIALVSIAAVTSAETIAETFRAALIATGWGIFAVAAATAISYVIANWQHLRKYFIEWRTTVPAIFNSTWAAVVAGFKETFKQLPQIGLVAIEALEVLLIGALRDIVGAVDKAFGWVPIIGKHIGGVRTKLNEMMQEIKGDMASRGLDIGNAIGGNMKDSFLTQWGIAMGTAARQIDAFQRAVTNSRPSLPGTALPPGLGGTTALAPGGTFKVPKGGVISPLPAGTGMSIIGTPYAPGSSHDQRDWQSGNALDVKVAAGTPVLAPFDGYVTWHQHGSGAPYTTDTGKFIFGAQMTLYGATDTMFFTHIFASVKSGTRVKKGQQIGQVRRWPGGTTHLHYSTEHGSPYTFQNAQQGFATSKPQDDGSGPSGGPDPHQFDFLKDFNLDAADVPSMPTVKTPKPKKATVRSVTAIQLTAKHINDAIADIGNKKLRDELRSRWKDIDGDIRKGISSDALTRISDRFASLRKIITDATKAETLRTNVNKMLATLNRLDDQGNLTKRQEKNLNALKAMLKRQWDAITKGGPTPAEVGRYNATVDKVQATLKRATDAAKERMKQTDEDIKANKDALRESLTGWLSSVGDLIRSSGIATSRFGTSLVSGLKASGVFLNNLTGPDFQTAVAQYKNAIVRLTKGGLTSAQSEVTKAAADNAQAIMQAYIEQLNEGVQTARQAFETSFNRLTDFALRLFDRSRAKLRAGIKVLVAGMLIGEGDLTPAEQALADAEQKQADEDYRRRLDAAKKALAIAKATGQGILDARRAYNDLLLEAQTKALQEQAKLERDAANEQLQAAQETFDEQASLDRDAFQQELSDIEARMAAGTETYEQGMKDVRNVFARYKVPIEDQSDAIGQALSAGLIRAFGAVEQAMGTLAAAIDRFVKAIRDSSMTAINVYRDVATAYETYASTNFSSGAFYQVGGAGGEVTPFPGKTFATGGIVGAAGGIWIKGRYTGKDTVPIMAGTGEMVINPEEQDRLFQFLTGRGGGMGGGGVIVNVYPQGSVIAERDLAETVREALAPVLRANGRRPI